MLGKEFKKMVNQIDDNAEVVIEGGGNGMPVGIAVLDDAGETIANFLVVEHNEAEEKFQAMLEDIGLEQKAVNH